MIAHAFNISRQGGFNQKLLFVNESTGVGVGNGQQYKELKTNNFILLQEENTQKGYIQFITFSILGHGDYIATV